MFARLLHPHRRDFLSLDEREILSLAVGAEEEDGAIYAELATRLATAYPATAKVFEGMAAEEDGHRRRLLDLYTQKFGERLVPIRREHVRGRCGRGSSERDLRSTSRAPTAANSAINSGAAPPIPST